MAPTSWASIVAPSRAESRSSTLRGVRLPSRQPRTRPPILIPAGPSKIPKSGGRHCRHPATAPLRPLEFPRQLSLVSRMTLRRSPWLPWTSAATSCVQPSCGWMSAPLNRRPALRDPTRLLASTTVPALLRPLPSGTPLKRHGCASMSRRPTARLLTSSTLRTG